MILINSLGLSHDYARRAVKDGDTAVDATCGKGRDTLFLSQLVGEKGCVFAFDIQDTAIEATKKLLEANNVSNTEVICESHARMDEFAPAGLACAMFNLGYLPGADHSLHTKGEITLKAIQKAMNLLKIGGIITIVIYQGGDTGFEERDMVLEFCKGIDQKQFTVMKCHFTNQKNNPPIFICMEKQ